jgi:hypothetical protein
VNVLKAHAASTARRRSFDHSLRSADSITASASGGRSTLASVWQPWGGVSSQGLVLAS